MNAVSKAFGAAVLAASAALSTGCATTNYGLPTYGGAAVGAAAGRAIDKSPVAVIGGAVLGGVVGNMFEKDCETKFNSTVSRNVNGNATGQWRGNETLNTKCKYSGNNPPANLNAPQHLEHLQQGPRPSPWR